LGYRRREMKKEERRKTYCYTGGDQVTLVQNKDQVLVRGFFLEILLDAETSCSNGTSGIENVDNHI